MKKTIVFMMAVGAVALANAAAVDWVALAVVDPVATAAAGKNTPASGWIGYLIMASDLSEITTDLAKGDTGTLTTKAVGASKTTSTKGGFDATTATGDVASGSQSFYVIVLNSGSADAATSYYVSNMVTENIDASLDTTIAFGSQLANSKDAANWQTMSVPEPTGAMLMLVGLAGLALRRKRA